MESSTPTSAESPAARRGCCLSRFVVLTVIIVGALILLLAIMSVGASVSETKTGLTEKIIAVGETRQRIAVIALTNTIGGWGNHDLGEGMAVELSRKLRAAKDDPTVKAILLEVDSPGGELTASDVLYHEILLLQQAGKKVVAAVGGMAASGGYYVIAPADYIFVQPTGMVGSFGVIMQHFEIEELLKIVGVRVAPLKSTDSKDIGSPFRQMTESERQLFEKILTAYHQRFVDIIAAGRKLPREKVAALATGEIYTAEEARQHQLVDAIGYHDDAVAYTRELLGGKPEIFIYEEPLNLTRLFSALLSGNSALQQLTAWGGHKVRAQ